MLGFSRPFSGLIFLVAITAAIADKPLSGPGLRIVEEAMRIHASAPDPTGIIDLQLRSLTIVNGKENAVGEFVHCGKGPKQRFHRIPLHVPVNEAFLKHLCVDSDPPVNVQFEGQELTTGFDNLFEKERDQESQQKLREIFVRLLGKTVVVITTEPQSTAVENTGSKVVSNPGSNPSIDIDISILDLDSRQPILINPPAVTADKDSRFYLKGVAIGVTTDKIVVKVGNETRQINLQHVVALESDTINRTRPKAKRDEDGDWFRSPAGIRGGYLVLDAGEGELLSDAENIKVRYKAELPKWKPALKMNSVSKKDPIEKSGATVVEYKVNVEGSARILNATPTAWDLDCVVLVDSNGATFLAKGISLAPQRGSFHRLFKNKKETKENNESNENTLTLANGTLTRKLKIDVEKAQAIEDFSLKLDSVLPIGPLAIFYNGPAEFSTAITEKQELATKSQALTGFSVTKTLGKAESTEKILRRHGRQLVVESKNVAKHTVTITNHTNGNVDLIVAAPKVSDAKADPEKHKTTAIARKGSEAVFSQTSTSRRFVDLFKANKKELEKLLTYTDGYHCDLKPVIEAAIQRLDDAKEIKDMREIAQTHLKGIDDLELSESGSRYDGFIARQRAYEKERLEKKIRHLDAELVKLRLRLEHAVAEATR